MKRQVEILKRLRAVVLLSFEQEEGKRWKGTRYQTLREVWSALVSKGNKHGAALSKETVFSRTTPRFTALTIVPSSNPQIPDTLAVIFRYEQKTETTQFRPLTRNHSVSLFSRVREHQTICSRVFPALMSTNKIKRQRKTEREREKGKKRMRVGETEEGRLAV